MPKYSLIFRTEWYEEYFHYKNLPHLPRKSSSESFTEKPFLLVLSIRSKMIVTAWQPSFFADIPTKRRGRTLRRGCGSMILTIKNLPHGRCCCSHMNSLLPGKCSRDHKTGSNNSGVEDYFRRKKMKQRDDNTTTASTFTTYLVTYVDFRVLGIAVCMSPKWCGSRG